jgi:streptogramin lyase
MKPAPLRYSLLVALALCASPSARANLEDFGPDLRQLEQVAQLPPELPQRVKGLAYDGEKIWATVYLGSGRYASLNPQTLAWEVSRDHSQHKAIAEVSGAFASPGAICFAEGRLWVAGAYGNSFGSIDTQDWKVERLFQGTRRGGGAGQSYSSMAYDGAHIWLVWHWYRYDLPTSETQLLLKVEPSTGKVVAEYPAPAGTRNDGTHGLTWDGARLWHMKDRRLSAVDPLTGGVTAQYTLEQLKRPSGLAWDGQSLWIAEFDGKIWRLPFRRTFEF